MKRNLPQGNLSFLDNHNFVMTTLTPVHIGSGFKLYKGLDFESVGEETRVLDVNKVFSLALEDHDLSNVVLQGRLISFAQSKQIDLDVVTKWKFDATCESNEIQENVRNIDDYPIIPGSSIKGSLRSILFNDRYSQNRNQYDSAGLVQLGSRFPGGKLEARVMSPKSTNPGNNPNFDIGRIFRPSDAVFKKSDLSIINVVIGNVTSRNGDETFMFKTSRGNSSSLTEATYISILGLLDNSKSKPFRISIDSKMSHQIQLPEVVLSAELFAKKCNEWSNMILKKELSYWSRYRENDLADSSYNEVLRLIKQVEVIQQQNENGKIAWMQRIGWGSGFTSLTGGYMNNEQTLKVRDVAFSERDIDFFPKSRRISDIADMPMGWVKVELAQ
jgi:CRISPR-associated protein Csm5